MKSKSEIQKEISRLDEGVLEWSKELELVLERGDDIDYIEYLLIDIRENKFWIEALKWALAKNEE